MNYVQTPDSYKLIMLDKSILKDKNFTNLSRILEQHDPTSKYVSTDLDGLDAYERQLKHHNIKVCGPLSDTLKAFYKDEHSLVLFYEYVRRRIYKHLFDTSEFKGLSKFINLVYYDKHTNTNVMHICNDFCTNDKLKGSMPINYSVYNTAVSFNFNLPDKQHENIFIPDFDDYLKAQAQRLSRICFDRFKKHLLNHTNNIYKIHKKELANNKSTLFRVYSGKQIDTVYCYSFDADFVIKNLCTENPTYNSIFHTDVVINNLVPKGTLMGLNSNNSIRINVGNDIIINPETFFNDRVELSCYFDIITVDNSGILLIEI